ncbi:MAG: AAA domain-containing protein [Neomegalonema sp.]|nr:AAA domain-containing protein [Neomegalonema sp.]
MGRTELSARDRLDAALGVESFNDLHDLLEEFAAFEEIGTEDVLAAVLPLMRQTLELHDQGQVAPLDGVEAIGSWRGRLYFGPGQALKPKWSSLAINRLQGMKGDLDIAGLYASAPSQLNASEPIGPRGETPTEPVFVPDYRCWEHVIGNHDPLTDIFSLGMIAASVALGLNFTEDRDLAAFVAHRRQLMQLNGRLHPVVAQVITQMTELDRRRRIQDLRAAISALENHRQTAASAEVAAEARSEALPREDAILTELRGRLYDLSRRNKLLFHKPSSNELNLTEASTPIVLRVEAIRPEQLFVWGGDLAERITKGATIPLSEFIRFEETLYAPPALDKIRNQARKDRTEFGFSQLRMVIAFLRWRNLKEDPEAPISSPLLLLPVELKKRRGVRDSFDLKATTTEAEVNPALRRYLKLIYGVELPASVDLEQPGAIEALHRSIAEQILRSEPGVKLTLRTTPDVAAMHERALRKVDLYRRRSKPSSTGVKRVGDISYSYARTNWRPLGLQMHQRYVAPAPAPARRGRSAQMALPLTDRRQSAAPADAAPLDRAASGAGAARMWEMDLCSVTLANFNYRKMSLVHDFDALLEGALKDDETGARSGAFGQLFSDAPKPIARPVSAPPVRERFEVMPSDPTQAAAVARARTGESYVIQGPPGTGKSQTIANLIADFVGRGKRVLFVCEKRAALDVVYNRLEGLGLHRLCARVHDSQEDKRGFVLDLKALYENWMGATPDDQVEPSRSAAIGGAEEGLVALTELDQGMMSSHEGEPVHKLISRAAQEKRPSGEEVRAHRLEGSDIELLPSLSDWREGRDAARAMEGALRRMGSEPILARHPARFVSAEASADPALFERLSAALTELGPHLKKMGDAAGLAVWDGVAPLAALFAQIDYAARLAPVAAAGRLRIMNPVSNEANAFRNDQRWLDEARETLERAQEKTKLWTEKLSDIETERALELARRHEGGLLSFMSSAWRQVKTEVEQRCKLHELAIRPLIKDLLADLAEEHDAQKEVERHLKQLAANLGVRSGAEALQIVEERDRGTPAEGARATPLLDLATRESEAASDRIQALAALKHSAEAARHAISTCFEGLEMLPVEHAFAALSELEAGRESLPAFAPALRALADAPDGVRAALRRIDASVDQIEAAIVDRAVERALAVRPSLRELSGAAVDETSGEIGGSLSDLRKLTAATLLERARRNFVEHIELTTRLDLELEADTQILRRTYVEARRDLDRELSKNQRFRSVRELMAGPAGLLIRDIKPIWLMSPLSVADVLPLDPDIFDVVIFDEASQVPVEEAAPTLFRAPQAIVVGDEKQLPPTNFFGSGPAEDDSDGAEPDLFGSEEDEGALDLDAESFLAQAAKALPSTLLGWHYRSRSEELIAFSNAVFYAGKLISIPSTLLAKPAEPIIAGVAEDGAEFWKETLARPVSFHHTPFAAYEKQKNTGEAAYIAEMIRGLLKAKTGKSIGVVAFSEAQQAQIEKALETLAKDDAKFRDLLDAEYEREEGGQFEGLFVKNLENVQGDERDVIVISVCYGPDRQGRMRMNFGPINRSGGEKRLNVIFSRAKEHVALVSTIKGDAITNDYNTGALCLKTYLKFADAVSRGDQPAMRRALAAVAPHAARELTHRETPLAETIAASLRDRGWEAEAHLGESAFVCDVAVRTPGADRHQLAVLIDGPAHYACTDLLERHVTRPGVLKAFGWKAMTVLSLDWRRNPEEVLSRIEKALAAA